MLYLSKLLVEALADPTARAKAIQDLASDIRLGETLRNYLLSYLADLGPEALYALDIADFPAVVIIDVHGRNFHESARAQWRRT